MAARQHCHDWRTGNLLCTAACISSTHWQQRTLQYAALVHAQQHMRLTLSLH